VSTRLASHLSTAGVTLLSCRCTCMVSSSSFFTNHTPPPALSTLSLHDALPIYVHLGPGEDPDAVGLGVELAYPLRLPPQLDAETDRKSTRLNSSHQIISYAVFCLKKKKTHEDMQETPHITSAQQHRATNRQTQP